MKKRVLTLLASCPQRSFSITELQETLHTSSRNLREALREFVELDVVRMITKKNRQYFQINQHFSFYEEISNLVYDKKSGIGQDLICRALKKLNGVKLAIITGVFTFQPHLEIDVLVVGEKVSSAKLNKVLDEVERLAGQEVNYTIMPLKEYQYRKVMRDRFIRSVIDNPHVVVVNNLRKKDDLY